MRPRPATIMSLARPIGCIASMMMPPTMLLSGIPRVLAEQAEPSRFYSSSVTARKGDRTLWLGPCGELLGDVENGGGAGGVIDRPVADHVGLGSSLVPLPA